MAALAVAIGAVVALRGRLADARNELARRQEEFARNTENSEKRFAELAAKALAANSESLRRQSVNSLAEVLAPMKDNIENFRRTVAECYTTEARERFALGKNIARLIELSETVGAETARLSSALKGNARVQGEWGEMILDNILRSAGLRPGYEYEIQAAVSDADGRRLRPDVIINYTEGRRIVIDSKVSIQDYLNMVDADSESSREAFAKAHLASVRKHIGELRSKAYQDAVGEGAFDYVLMFIPNEGAFLAALNLDRMLWQTAYESHVLIISPTHLMAVVKLIEQMWRHDRQNRNALAIAEEAGRMLDKFRGFLDDLDKIDKSLLGARDAWNAAYSKLSGGSGNLVARAQKLEQLGAKAKKPLPGRYNAPDAD